MRAQNLSIKVLTVVVLVILAVGAIGFSIFGAKQFSQLSVELQKSTISRMIHIAADQVVTVMHDRAVQMLSTYERPLRTPVQALIKDPANEAIRSDLDSRLNDLFNQRYATLGLLDVRKFRLYDTNLNPVHQSSAGMEGLNKAIPGNLQQLAVGRTGADRLKVVGSQWSEKGDTLYSVLMPIGGLRVIGYLEAVVHPQLNLQYVADILQLPLTIRSANGEELFRSENWQQNQVKTSLDISYFFGEPDSGLELVVLEDMAAFYSRVNNVRLLVVAGVVVLMLLGVVISLWLFNKEVFRPLEHLVSNMRRCSDGDLTVDSKKEGLREIASVTGALGDLIAQLRGQVVTIHENSVLVSSSAENLSKITDKVNAAAQKQKNENDHVSVSINEMASTVSQVASSAVNAANAAKEADMAAQEGKQLVNETINVIQSLSEDVQQAAQVIREVENDSGSVGQVLEVIRDIADQTNLLALNAAIEAARAGEQGRGFAVVADEVRTLASRTQDSTKEINDIIQRLQNGTRHAVEAMERGCDQTISGVEQALKAQAGLDAITNAVGSIVTMNEQIASSAEQQSAMSAEINVNVQSIHELVEETTLGAKDTSVSAEELFRLAKNLSALVSEFKV